MAFDIADGVLVAPLGRNIRPHPRIARMPRAVGQKGDPRRRVPETERVIQVEILQLVGSNDRLAGLELVLALNRGDELRTDFGPQHVEQRLADFWSEAVRIRDPTDDVL